jgi:hypothetical protein
MAIRTLSEVPVISMEGQVEAADYILTIKIRAASEAVGREPTAEEEEEAGVVVVEEGTITIGL